MSHRLSQLRARRRARVIAPRGPELWNTADVSHTNSRWSESGGVWTKSAVDHAHLGLITLASVTWYEARFKITAATGLLNLWRINAANSANEQAASSLGTGTHRVIVKTGPAADPDGHHLWFDGSAFTGSIEALSFREMTGDYDGGAVT